MGLGFEAVWLSHTVFAPNGIQLSSGLSIKTDNCTGNCTYCSQSCYATGISNELLAEAADKRSALVQTFLYEYLIYFCCFLPTSLSLKNLVSHVPWSFEPLVLKSTLLIIIFIKRIK